MITVCNYEFYQDRGSAPNAAPDAVPNAAPVETRRIKERINKEEEKKDKRATLSRQFAEPDLTDDAGLISDPAQCDLLNNVTRLPTRPVDHVPEAVRLWNDMAEKAGLSIVQKVTARRRVACAARLKDCGGIEGWAHAVSIVPDSPFLMGQVNSFKACFDFLCQESSFTKLMEGTYHNRGTAKGARPDVEALIKRVFR